MKPIGKPDQVNCFDYSDHAGDRAISQSQKNIILDYNLSLIIWYYKRQNTVESSTFGTEFVALQIAADLIVSLRYKLRMIGYLLKERRMFL